MPDETFAALLERLAEERRLSAVSHDAWNHGNKGTSTATLRKVRERKRLPNPALIEAIAAALDERPPSLFPEYGLAKARHVLERVTRLLDEHTHGIDSALGTLLVVSEPIRLLEAADLPESEDQGDQPLEDTAQSALADAQDRSQQAQDADEDSR